MKERIDEAAAKSVEALLADGTSVLRDGQLLWSLSHLWDQPRYRRLAEQVAEVVNATRLRSAGLLRWPKDWRPVDIGNGRGRSCCKAWRVATRRITSASRQRGNPCPRERAVSMTGRRC